MAAAGDGGWQTIESDAGVFTYLIEELGVKGVQFEELLSLDRDSLTALSPVYGLIFLFKFPTDAPYVASDRGAPLDGSFDLSASESPSLFFAHQSIQNACGTQALLSVLLNKDHDPTNPQPRSAIDVGPTLQGFKSFTIPLPPDLRGEALSNSVDIRTAHNSFARASPFADEVARDPRAGTEDAFHFIAYVPVNGILYELDGLQPHPISHGPCSEQVASTSDDSFAARIVPVLQRRVQRYPAHEIRFNLLAVTQDLRAKAKEDGDWHLQQRAEAQRREWEWENALRRCNLLGFAGAVIKEVAKTKVEGREENEGFSNWIETGRSRTRKRLEDQRKGKAMDVDEDGMNVG